MEQNNKQHTILKRALSLLLAAVMCISVMPMLGLQIEATASLPNLHEPLPSPYTCSNRTSDYGWRTWWYPQENRYVTDRHTGIDMYAPENTPIYSVDKGKVVFAGADGGCGNVVIIEHSHLGIYSAYLHQIDGGICVSVGQTVTSGQMIGHVGMTGTATGFHLHLELRTTQYYGSDIDPTPGINYTYSYDGGTPSHSPEAEKNIKKFNETATSVDAYYKLASGKTSAVVRSSPYNGGDSNKVGTLTSGVEIHVTKKGENTQAGHVWYYIGDGQFAGYYIYSENVTKIDKCTTHTWNSGKVTIAASCTAAGVKTYTCTKCGATKTESISALGHSYGNWTVYSDSHRRVCTRCGSAETYSHTWDNGAANAAKNTCTVCGATVSRYVSVEINPAGGTWNGTTKASSLQQLPGSTVQLGNASGYDGHDFVCWTIDYTGSDHVLQPWGSPLHHDPSFCNSMSDIAVYNNAGNGTVTATKVSKTSDAPTSSAYMLQVKTTGNASPGLGGFYQLTYSKKSGVFYHMIIAKIPVGYKIERNSNACGDGHFATWLTSQEGTGKFEVYIYKQVCGTTGNFSSFGHVYLTGAAATSSNPITWYVAYSEVFDGTGVSESGSNLIVGSGIAILRAIWKEGHTWDNGTVTKDATFDTAGVRTYKCTGCSETKTETIPARGTVMIHFNANGGTGSMADIVEKYGTTVTVPATTYKRPGYRQLGWVIYRHSDKAFNFGGNGWSSSRTITSDPWTDSYYNRTGDWSFAVNSSWYNNAAKDVTNEEFTFYAVWTNCEHTWDAGEITQPPTCYTSGKKTYTCTVCGEKQEAILDPIEISSTPVLTNAVTENGHTYFLYAAKMTWDEAKAWCENNDGYLCTITSEEEQAIVQTIIVNQSSSWLGAERDENGDFRWITGESWSYSNWADGEPNNISEECVQFRDNYKWNDYNRTSSSINGFIMETGNPLCTLHSWDSGNVTTAATCTATGVTTYTCTVCNATRTEEIAPTGHTEVADAAVPATCTSSGKTAGSHCAVCNAVIKTPAIIKASGHNYGAWTELDDVQHQRVCANDNSHVERAAHTWDAGRITTPATCAAVGVKTFSCTVCGATKTETINKTTDHQWGNVNETKAPTAVEEGEKTYRCTVCGATKTEPIPKIMPFGLGDADGNGKVEAADARLALRISVKLEQDIVKGSAAYNAADYDQNGVVEPSDARCILRVSVKLDPFG